jgi:hypothetical protein
MYQQQLASPAYSQAQGAIAQGANQTGNQVATELGARGIGTSGTGAILSSLTPSIVGSQMGQLKTGAYNSAQQQAQNTIQQQIANLQGTSGPSQSRQLFAGGLDAFLPFLLQHLGKGLPTNSLQDAGNYGAQPWQFYQPKNALSGN